MRPKPTYKTGFARYAAASEAPQLRNRLAGAWLPEIGESGDTLRDLAGRASHGTLSGTTKPTWMVYRGRRCLDFDGSSSRVTLANSLNQTGPLTIAAWINTDTLSALGSCAIISNESGIGGLYDYILEINRTPGRISFIWGSSVVLVGSTSMSVGVWNHVACMRRGTIGNWTAEVYLNGKLDGTATTSANPNAIANSPVGIGYSPTTAGSLFFDGKISEVCLWPIALPAAAIGRHYADSLALWRLCDDVLYGQAPTLLPPGLLDSGLVRGAA